MLRTKFITRTLKNYYKTLGLLPNATDFEIKAKYDELKTTNEYSGPVLHSDVHEAYNVLSDKSQRTNYDKLLWKSAYQRAMKNSTFIGGCDDDLDSWTHLGLNLEKDRIEEKKEDPYSQSHGVEYLVVICAWLQIAYFYMFSK